MIAFFRVVEIKAAVSNSRMKLAEYFWRDSFITIEKIKVAWERDSCLNLFDVVKDDFIEL